MLRMHAVTDAQGAKAYFDAGLVREDYYTEGREVIGRWGGIAAELLGLGEAVERDKFHALCENVNPATGEHLTARTKDNRRVGYDISFSCPKSVSVHQALTDNAEMLGAFQKSVRETMAEMERDMKTRVRVKGQNEDRTTGNLVWAEFVHYTARPVQGKADPHLHAHCFTFNATYDAQEGRWKAGQFGDLKRDARYYEAAFNARLAENLQSLGYRIERTAGGWELAGYTREVCEQFSRRTQVIEAFAKSRGITNPEALGELGAKTREHKLENEDKDSQRAEWAARLSPEARAAVARIEARRQGVAPDFERAGRQKMEPAALDHAQSHAFERNAVVSEKALLEEALRFGVGSVSVDAVKAAYLERVEKGAILARELHGQKMVTTREVLAEERRMVALAREGRARFRPLGSAGYEGRPELSEDQRAALAHVLGSRDFVTLIGGKAGTGKTTMMRDAVAGIEAAGKQVLAFAPSSDAALTVLREKEGFAGADTVARLLVDREMQSRLKGNVLWVDEAGLLGARTMRHVLELAAAHGARVVLAGDVGQHGPVERGDALRTLERDAGVKSATIFRIFRQKNERYRGAVQALADGKTLEGFDRLAGMGSVLEVADETERLARISGEYVRAVADGKEALVVAPTHREGEKVTAAIRAELKGLGRLSGEEAGFFQQRNLSWTAAQRADASRYAPGQVVQFHNAGSGFRRGERALVVAARSGMVIVEKERGGERALLPLDAAERFEVFETARLAIAKGDKIRITRNGRTEPSGKARTRHDLRNGSVYEVAGFTRAGDIKLANGWIVSRAYGNMAHGYCTTSHASQGKTVDRVIIAQSAESFGASNREQFYVSVSRGREQVTIFTDDNAALRRQIERSGARLSAADIAGRGDFQTRRASRIREMALRFNRVMRETGQRVATVARRVRGLER